MVATGEATIIKTGIIRTRANAKSAATAMETTHASAALSGKRAHEY